MSDNYIVSARKYRPQTFDTVVGQEHITTTLKNAIKNQHLAHAYLFCGPRGVGKTTCARILANTINCENLTADTEACGVCETCVRSKENTTVNIIELDAASKNTVDDIREVINQVRFAPLKGKYKVFIIDEVHMLTGSAFNAFLKTLEEPPPHAIFILATTEKHKILPTILSRCQLFEFRRITVHDIVAHLQSIASKEGMIAQEAALHVIAQKSEGAMRDALSMLDRIASFTNGMLTYSNTMEHLNLLDADFYFRLTDSLLSQDVASTLLLLDQALEKGFEGDIIINGLAEHFRNLLLCKDARMAKLLDVPNDHRPMYNEKANQSPPSFILSALNVINDSELQYKTATNKRLHVEMCLIRLCFLLQSVSGSGSASLTMTTPGGDDVKKNFSNVGGSAPLPMTDDKEHPVNNIVETIVEEVVVKYTPPPSDAAVVPVPPIVGSATEPRTTPVQAVMVSEVEPRPTPTGSKRLSMNMLQDMDAEVAKAAANKVVEIKEITKERAEELFDAFKKKLQAESKSVLYSQFSMMRVAVYPPDEVRVISPSELTDNYARDQKTPLIDFYRAETKMIVRITTEIQEDEAVKAAQNNVVLSKSEMYEAMARKNPSLAALKDGLAMQIEY